MIPIPVYLYDIGSGTAPDAPDVRVILTCRRAEDQQQLVTQLRAWAAEGRFEGAPEFWAAVPRTAWVNVALEAGSSVEVKGYAVASETVAAILSAAAEAYQQPAPTEQPPTEPAPTEPAPTDPGGTAP